MHDFPLYCVSIGLQVEGELVAGVILEPTRDEMFWAAQGRGAWVNSERLQVSGAERLEESLLCTGFPPNTQQQDRLFTVWRHLSHTAQSLRRTGSTAINLAYLAAGRKADGDDQLEIAKRLKEKERNQNALRRRRSLSGKTVR